MKLLLDEMYWPALADQLVARGHDVIAAKADASLTGLSDEDLFVAAQVRERTVVTENVGDFIPIVQAHAGAAVPHHGLVLVSSRARPRDRANVAATLGAMVTALDLLLKQDPDTSGGSWVTWLVA